MYLRATLHKCATLSEMQKLLYLSDKADGYSKDFEETRHLGEEVGVYESLMVFNLEVEKAVKEYCEKMEKEKKEKEQEGKMETEMGGEMDVDVDMDAF